MESLRRIKVEPWEAMALVLLTGVGFWLRIHQLGQFSLYGDEDLTGLAVRSILNDGHPHMPSGMAYWRAPLYSYLLAGFTYLFGLNEWTLRFPNVLFGTATIPLFYLLGKRWIGMRPALLATALLTFSSFHIIFSRMGRMYAMFLFFLILTMYYFLRGIMDEKRSYLYLSFGIGIVTTTLHELGMVLGILFLIPILIRVYSWKEKLIFGVMGISLTLFSGLFQEFEQRSVQAITGNLPKTPSEETASTLFSALGLNHLKFYPPFRIVGYFLHEHPFFYAGIILITLAMGYFICRRSTVKELFLLFMLSLFNVLNLFGLFVITLFGVGYFAAPMDWRKIDRRLIVMILLTGIAFFAFWNFYGLTAWRGEGLGSFSTVELIRKVIKDGVYFPAMHIMVFFTDYPVMTLMVLVGTAFWFYKQNIGRSNPLEALLHLSFWLPLLVIGITREWVELRYLFPLYPLFLLIFSETVGWIGRASNAISVQSKIPFLGRGVIFALVFAPVLFWGGHGIPQAFSIATADSGERTSPDLNSGLPIFPDHKGAGLFLRPLLQKEDVVIAMDATEQMYYLGRVDYWLRDWRDAKGFAFISEGKRKDVDAGAEILYDFKGFLEVLCGSQKPVWIITSAEVSGYRYKNLFVPPEVWLFLESHPENREWVGKDGLTEVYRFAPGTCADSSTDRGKNHG